MTTDVTEFDGLPRLIEQTVQELDSLDVLVNNAGGEVTPSFLDTRAQVTVRRHRKLALVSAQLLLGLDPRSAGHRTGTAAPSPSPHVTGSRSVSHVPGGGSRMSGYNGEVHGWALSIDGGLDRAAGQQAP